MVVEIFLKGPAWKAINMVKFISTLDTFNWKWFEIKRDLKDHFQASGSLGITGRRIELIKFIKEKRSPFTF